MSAVPDAFHPTVEQLDANLTTGDYPEGPIMLQLVAENIERDMKIDRTLAADLLQKDSVTGAAKTPLAQLHVPATNASGPAVATMPVPFTRGRRDG
jgi:hypothetical protein